MEWQIEDRDGDLEIRYGGELFGLLPADDRALLTDEAALTEWVERELLAHAEKLTAALLATIRASEELAITATTKVGRSAAR